VSFAFAWVMRPAVLFVFSLAVVPSPADAKPARFEVNTTKSALIVDVHPTLKMSAISHEHHFHAQKWRGAFVFDRDRPSDTRGEIVVEANSLHDKQPELSDSDVKKIDKQVASSTVLDAARYPSIRMTFERFDILSQKEGRMRGTLVGTLTLHGVTHPITVPLTAWQKGETLRVIGNTALEQSKFGIKPYSTPLGTVGIKDRVEIHFDVVAEQPQPAKK
jgi:polyisoprenoid-binding protein YceI